MPIHSFVEPGAFGPEALAARFGERDPARLLEAALRKPD
jgi:hypothetical protein